MIFPGFNVETVEFRNSSVQTSVFSFTTFLGTAARNIRFTVWDIGGRACKWVRGIAISW